MRTEPRSGRDPVERNGTRSNAARCRQELWMRVVVLIVVCGLAAAGAACTLLYGPSVNTVPMAMASLALLGWIVRRLFPED